MTNNSLKREVPYRLKLPRRPPFDPSALPSPRQREMTPARSSSRVPRRLINGETVALEVLRNEAKIIFQAFNFHISQDKIVYDKRLKTSGGTCQWQGGSRLMRNIVKITINPHIEEPLDVWEVLAHECSHGIQVLKTGTTAHDDEFYKICRIALDCLGLPESQPYRLHTIQSLYQYQKTK